MKQLFTCLLVCLLVASCGIKRPLELPCQTKRHKTTPDNAEAGTQATPPADNTTPCPKTPASNGTPQTTTPPPAAAPATPITGGR